MRSKRRNSRHTGNGSTHLRTRILMAAVAMLGVAAMGVTPVFAATPTSTAQSGSSYDPLPEEKRAMPTLTKEVSLDNATWGDTVDASSFDVLYYRVTGTLPSYTEPYDEYPYTFVDQHEDGILVDMGSVHIVHVHGDSKIDVSNKFRIEVTDGALVATCTDLKSNFPYIDGEDKFVMTYKANLSGEPDIGLGDPNENECYLLYMTDKLDSKPDYAYGTGATGETPTPPVITFVYTYALDISKVSEGESKPLAGAEFVVKNSHGAWMSSEGWEDSQDKARKFVTDQQGHVEIRGLGTGAFSIIETKAPAGFNAVDPIEITIGRAFDENQKPKLSVQSSGGTVDKVDPQGGVITVTVKDPVSDMMSNIIKTAQGGKGSGGGPLVQMGAGIPLLLLVVIMGTSTAGFAYAKRKREKR